MGEIIIIDNYVQIECFRNQHILHLDCYNSYINALSFSQEQRCHLCMQIEITEMDWVNIGIIFNFDPSVLLEIEELPSDAQDDARSFRRGEITREQLQMRADKALFCYLYAHIE